MGVTQIDTTQTINNATWRVQPDVLTSESGIVKENGTIHYINGKLKYHVDGLIKEVGLATDYALTVLGVQTVLPAEGGGAAVGDRYLVLASGVAEWNGFVWTYVIANATATVGALVVNTSSNTTYRWNGSAWATYTAVTEFAIEVLAYVDTVGTATTGNKYLMSAVSEDPYTIAEYNGTTWVYTPLVDGQIIEVLATGKTYRYDSNVPLSPLTEYGEQKALAKLTLSRKTDSYTLVYADQLKTIEMNKATANTLTVPANVFVAGNQILITQYGAGQTTIAAGAGMTLRSDGGKLKINTQYSMATILFISATEAYVSGNLAL